MADFKWPPDNMTISPASFPLLAPAGSASAPSYSFSGDSNTGMYSAAADQINFATSGTQMVAITTTSLTIFGNHIVTGNISAGAGTVSAPSYAFSGTSSNTGLYLVATDSLGFSANGVNVGQYSSSGAWTIGESGGTQTHIVNGQVNISRYGSVGGLAPTANILWQLYNSGTYTLTGTTAYGLYSEPAFSSTQTVAGHAVFSQPRTVAASYTIPLITNFYANATQKGAGSSITRIVSFYDATGIGTATNRAVLSDNSSFTGDWFINSTSTNKSRLSGILELGSTASTQSVLYITNSSVLSAAEQRCIHSSITSSSAATNETVAFYGEVTTANSSYTSALRAQFFAANPTKGAASTITRDVGFYMSGSPNDGTHNAAFADNTSFTGDWFINSTSTNKSQLTGALALVRFDVASAATIAALDSTRSFVKLTGSTATTIQGIVAGVDGQRLTVVNLTGANMTVSHENGSASAANRITTMTGADVVTTANGAAEFVYDTGSSRWLCLYVTA